MKREHEWEMNNTGSSCRFNCLKWLGREGVHIF